MVRKYTYYLMEFVALVAFLYATYEQAKYGMRLGGDASFHMSRISEIRQAFLGGHLPTWINLHSFFGLGQAINGMYPDITLWPLILVTLWLPFDLQLVAVNGLIFLMTYVVTLISLKNHHFGLKVSNTAAIIYSFSGYALYQFLFEFQPGAAIIYAFSFPILFYMIDVFNRQRIDFRLMVRGGLLFMVILFSHLLSAVVLAVIVGFGWILKAVIDNRVNLFSIGNLIGSSGLALLTSLPVLARVFLIKKSGVADPFGKGVVGAEGINDLFSNLQIYSRTSLSVVAIILLMVILVAAKKDQQMTAILLFETGMMALCTNIVPWVLIQRLPLINMFQFTPWRFGIWLSILPLFGVLVMKGNHSSDQSRKRLLLMLLALGISLASFGTIKDNVLNLPISSRGLSSARQFSQKKYKSYHNRLLIRDYAPAVTVTSGIDDRVSDHVKKMTYSPQVADGQRKVTAQRSYDRRGVVFKFSGVKSKGPIILPMYGYQSLVNDYSIRVNGKRVSSSLVKVEKGSLAISGVKNHQSETVVSVGFKNPKWYLMSIVVSTGMMILELGYLLFQRYKKDGY